MLPQILNHNIYAKRHHLKMRFENVLVQIPMLNKDRHLAKSIGFKKTGVQANSIGLSWFTCDAGNLVCETQQGSNSGHPHTGYIQN
jgi:hypothetical protein